MWPSDVAGQPFLMGQVSPEDVISAYLMMNSEIATSVMLEKKLNIVVLDNGGFGCIDRLQRSCSSASFNNLTVDCHNLPFHRHDQRRATLIVAGNPRFYQTPRALQRVSSPRRQRRSLAWPSKAKL